MTMKQHHLRTSGNSMDASATESSTGAAGMDCSDSRRSTVSLRLSAAGRMTLSDDKLKEWCPELYGFKSLLKPMAYPNKGQLKERLALSGKAHAAVVISTSPQLLVAAYSGRSQLDCVAMLRFPQELVERYELKPGSRLLTMNSYCKKKKLQPDLIKGEQARDDSLCGGFEPLVADFLVDDDYALNQRKGAISSKEWKRCFDLGRVYVSYHPGVARNGNPRYAHVPAVMMMGDTANNKKKISIGVDQERTSLRNSTRSSSSRSRSGQYSPGYERHSSVNIVGAVAEALVMGA